MDDEDEGEVSRTARGIRFFRDVVVDVLGTLVPGTAFLAISGVLLHWPLYVLLSQVNGGDPALDKGTAFKFADPLQALLDLQEHVSIAAMLLLLMFGYVVGHFFSRQDPKTVDQASFKRISKKWADEERHRWVCLNNPEFPYRRLRNYLVSRDLHYLTSLVRWSDEDDAARSKSYINTLKTRLLWDYPGRCSLILKNEAHVRLMSSAWFMCRALYWIALGSLLLGGAALIAENRLNILNDAILAWAGLLALPGLLCIAASWYARRKAELALHYQRVREVRHVLDTAYYAYDKNPGAIQDLCPEYKGILGPDDVDNLRREESERDDRDSEPDQPTDEV